MASVYFDPALGGDGSTVTDDNNATTGLGNNGHRTRFVPALSQTVVMAGTATTKAAQSVASASTASTAATTATTKAGEAAASAAAAQSAANSGDNWRYLFSTVTTSGPAYGILRFNNATYTSVTEIYISELMSDGVNITALIQMLDDSTSANKSKITIRSTTTPTTYITFNVTGAVVDNGNYNTITVNRIAGAGVFADNAPVVVSYRLTGDKGDSGVVAASSVSLTPAGNIAATDVQAAIAELDSEKLARVGGICQNLSAVRVDKGTVSTGTVTFSLGGGNVQRLQVGGALTIALSGWPTAGNHATIKLNIVNGGSATITWPAIQWIQKDGTSTTNISTYLSNIGRNALQASGLDEFVLWSDDAGTTVRGKIL